MSGKIRLAIVVSHPIQYYVPLYRALAQSPRIDLHVVFASRIGLDKKLDVEMGVEVAWAMDLLGGYAHEFLPEAERIERTGLREVNNPSVSRALARLDPDAVIINGYAMATMLRALVWCRRKGVPALLTSDSSTHASGPGLMRTLKTAILPSLLRQYHAFLTMSDRSEAHLAALKVPRDR